MKLAFLAVPLLLTALLFTLAPFELGTVDSCSKAYATFTFDDGYVEHYTKALPLLQKHDVKGTAYVITEFVGGFFENNSLMNWSQVTGLADDGWEIGSHTLTHPDLTYLTEQEIAYELNQSKNVLLAKGFNVSSLSIPYGRYDEVVKAIAADYYSSVRPSIWGVNHFSDLDVYALKSYWFTNSTSMDQIKLWVDSVKPGDWIIFMVHLITDDESVEYSVSEADLEELILYLKAKGIIISTVSGVLGSGCYAG